jgi:nitroreductase
MSTPAPGVAALRALAARATLAPSMHNSQPWHWTIYHDHVELELDTAVATRLSATAPDARELVMSCGAALLTLRVAAAQALFDTRVEITPQVARPDLLARVTFLPGTVDAAFAVLDDAIPLRRTAWTVFDSTPLPSHLAGRLSAEAFVEGAYLTEIAPGDRECLAGLIEHADRERYDDPARRAELAGWIVSRWADDGHQASAPAVRTRAVARRPDLGARIAAHDVRSLREAPYAAVLSTVDDDRRSWVMAGQALQRVLLVAARHQVSGGLLNAPCQVETDRERLRDLVPGARYPQLILRLGHPVSIPPDTGRRPLDEVVTVRGTSKAPRRGYVIVSPREARSDFTEDALG